MKTSTTIGMSQNRGSSSFIIHASWKKIANFSHWEFFAPTALVMWFFGGFRGLPVWVGRLLPSTARPPFTGEKPCPHVANGVSLYLLKCANVVSSCMSPQKKSQPRPWPFHFLHVFLWLFLPPNRGGPRRWMDEVPGLTRRWLPKRVYISKTAQKETWAGNKRQVDDMQMDIFGRGKFNSGTDPVFALQNGLRGHQQWWLVVTEKLIWWCII